MQQLTFEPLEPKPGTVKAVVLDFLRGRPDGSCRRDFALDAEVYEVSARIGELQKDGWVIGIRKCSRHDHRKAPQMVEYFL